MPAKPTVDGLQRKACLFWPESLAKQAREVSVIPRLIETQEKFIGILYVSDGNPAAWQQVLPNTDGMAANLFLKHLMVLSNVSGELLQRLHTTTSGVCAREPMQFVWRGKQHEHRFASFSLKLKWSNKDLFVDGRGLAQPAPLGPATADAAMLILHGAAALNPGLPSEALDQCVLGTLLGQKAELDRFVRQRYIWVSRITGGGYGQQAGPVGAGVRERTS